MNLFYLVNFGVYGCHHNVEKGKRCKYFPDALYIDMCTDALRSYSTRHDIRCILKYNGCQQIAS